MKDFNQEKDTLEDDIETNKVGDQIEEKIEKFRDQMSRFISEGRVRKAT